MSSPRSPTDLLEAFGTDRRQLGEATLAETYTMQGLLSVLWFGAQDARDVVICCSGAMGGLIGPARGVWHDLGVTGQQLGRGLAIVDYRQPEDDNLCLIDALATADRALRQGAERLLFVGHSFGGAVAVQCGIATADACVGVLGLATQSAGCENAMALAPTPLLLLHGSNDQILPSVSSLAVRDLAGYGDVEIIEGASHGLSECVDVITDRAETFFNRCFTPSETETPG
ncbi:MAG: alpha/beta hydrolase [Acidobacteria bacterium]|nr:alpha/beta hydrolase [Acidobacteriota bacterium]